MLSILSIVKTDAQLSLSILPMCLLSCVGAPDCQSGSQCCFSHFWILCMQKKCFRLDLGSRATPLSQFHLLLRIRVRHSLRLLQYLSQVFPVLASYINLKSLFFEFMPLFTSNVIRHGSTVPFVFQNLMGIVVFSTSWSLSLKAFHATSIEVSFSWVQVTRCSTSPDRLKQAVL